MYVYLVENSENMCRRVRVRGELAGVGESEMRLHHVGCTPT